MSEFTSDEAVRLPLEDTRESEQQRRLLVLRPHAQELDAERVGELRLEVEPDMA